MTRDELEAIARVVFDAVESLDEPAVRAICHADARFSSTTIPAEIGLDEFVAAMSNVRERLGSVRYENVQRLYCEPDAFVEQHDVRTGSTAVEITACVVVRVDETGKVLRFDDYVGVRQL